MNYNELLHKEIGYLKKLPLDKLSGMVTQTYEAMKPGTRIITSGMGKAGQIAHTFATTLSSTGSPAYFLHPAEAQHGDLGIVGPDDIIFLFSNSGKTREVLELTDLIVHLGYGNKMFAIVGNSSDQLERNCADILVFGPTEEICLLGLTPTTSTTCMSVICDLFVVGLMELRKTTKEQYSKLHHGGYLGQKAKS